MGLRPALLANVKMARNSTQTVDQGELRNMLITSLGSRFADIDSAPYAQPLQGQSVMCIITNNVQSRPSAVTGNEEEHHVLTTASQSHGHDHLEEGYVQGEEYDDGNKDTKFDKELFIEEIRGLRCLYGILNHNTTRTET
eukprot:Seg8759.1 transcript_id=Seg8759.1/GoldUCD/mRNA.D3Y31 product="hypothetical protein" protein_id=Seg8759.1/GoldUCD/D3Y31